MDTTALDRQMGDLVWCFISGLRAGFSITQVFDMLNQEAPESAKGTCKIIFNDLLQNVPLVEALEKWKQAYPSALLAKVADRIIEEQLDSGYLVELLVPLEAEFIRQAGSDPAFYKAMRRDSKQIEAPLPERAAIGG